MPKLLALSSKIILTPCIVSYFICKHSQGMDLEVVKSGGELLGRHVRRVMLEVISDDCRAIYEGQPLCSEVVATMAGLGFEQLTPMPCRPSFYRGRANSKCELEMVFRHRSVPPPGAVAASLPSQLLGVGGEDGTIAEDVYLAHHVGHFNWCTSFYPIAARSPAAHQPGVKDDAILPPDAYPPGIWRSPPAGAIVAGSNRNNDGVAYYSSKWVGSMNHPRGQTYMCPASCLQCVGSRRECALQANATHLLGIEWNRVMRTRLGCPFW